MVVSFNFLFVCNEVREVCELSVKFVICVLKFESVNVFLLSGR